MMFHCCVSLGYIERKLDAKQKTFLEIDGRDATEPELREVIARCRANGYTVLPPCDHIDTQGHCAGHSEYAASGVEISGSKKEQSHGCC